MQIVQVITASPGSEGVTSSKHAAVGSITLGRMLLLFSKQNISLPAAVQSLPCPSSCPQALPGKDGTEPMACLP